MAFHRLSQVVKGCLNLYLIVYSTLLFSGNPKLLFRDIEL